MSRNLNDACLLFAALCCCFGSALGALAAITFQDVTQAANITHTHSHALDAGPESSVNIASPFNEYLWMTGGAVAEDFDGDGWIDLYVLQGGESANLLYMNEGDGSFTDEAAARGAASTGLHMGVSAADFDSDGDIDITDSSMTVDLNTSNQYPVVAAEVILLINNGTGQFTAQNVVVPLGQKFLTSPSWGDLDADGDLDLVVGEWNVTAATTKLNIWHNFEGQLEWELKMYFAMNGALHDSAIAAWGCKRVYDYVRPISSIRYMAGLGQSTDASGPSYDPDGLPLVFGVVEVITLDTVASGQRQQHLADFVGDIAIKAWTSSDSIDPETEHAGVDWILGESWLPYQRDTFVTPAFAGYISGHSTFIRAAAEVLTEMTGSPFFPGGMGQFTAHQNVPSGCHSRASHLRGTRRSVGTRRRDSSSASPLGAEPVEVQLIAASSFEKSRIWSFFVPES